MKILVKAPAKINLSLDVLHKRSDGYHEVEMIMTTVDLADRIELTGLEEDKIKIDVSEGFVPSDERNLAYQAAQKLKDKLNVKKGVSIFISKQIPVSAGLAGGSSDAAATLKGLNQLWKLGLSTKELAEIGSEVGSDVSFCVYGGTAFATGRGEIIKPIASPPPCWVILAKPPIGVSTGEVYRRVNVDTIKRKDVTHMISALETNNYEGICSNLHNVLEEVTFKLHPEVAYIKESMKKFGADGVLMSGSGPTVFGLVRRQSRMQRVYNGLKGFCEHVYAVRLISQPHLIKNVQK